MHLIPLGFVSVQEAFRRAEKKWGNDASGHLRGLLSAGQLRALRVDSKGDSFEVEPSFWKINQDANRALFTFQRWGADDETDTFVFEENTLISLLPDSWETVASTTTQAVPKRKGGRPPTYDKIAFIIEATFLLYSGKKFDSEPSFRQAALDAYSAAHLDGNDVPSDEWCREDVTRVWDRFKPNEKQPGRK